MSSLDRSLDGMAFLSGHVGAVLRRRLREVGGIVLIAFALMTALALATWSVDDPSLSHATDAHVHNLLGRPGAIAADLVMQLLGLGSLALILPLSVWVYRLLGLRPAARRPLASAMRPRRCRRRRYIALAGDADAHAACR